MKKGVVKWFNNTKGYGFIGPEEAGEDVFVHVTQIEKSGISNLAEGQRVTYELATNQNGKTSAVDIKLI